MELKTYIELTKTVSFLRGAANAASEAYVEDMFKAVADGIEKTISTDLPWELKKSLLPAEKQS